MPPPLPVMTEMHDGWGMASDHQEKLMTADQAAAVLSAPTRSGPRRRISVTCIRAPSCRTRNTGRRPTWPPRLRHAGCEVHEQVDGTGVVFVLWTSDIVTAWDRSMCDLENRLSELAREPSRPALITWEIRRCQTSYSLCTSTM